MAGADMLNRSVNAATIQIIAGLVHPKSGEGHSEAERGTSRTERNEGDSCPGGLIWGDAGDPASGLESRSDPLERTRAGTDLRGGGEKTWFELRFHPGDRDP